MKSTDTVAELASSLPSDSETDVTAMFTDDEESDSDWRMSGDEDTDFDEDKIKKHDIFYFEEGNLYLLVSDCLKTSKDAHDG